MYRQSSQTNLTLETMKKLEKTQLEKVIENKEGVTRMDEYVVAFPDGTVSDVLIQGTSPYDSEGNYVRVFMEDSLSDIQAKLGSLLK